MIRALLVLAAILSLSPAQAQRIQFPGSASGGVAVSTYIGPGDIVAGAKAWYGLRAYSAATIGTKAIQITRASDSATADILTKTNGRLDADTAQTFCAATTCTVSIFYDQTGNGFDVSCQGCVAIQIPALTFRCAPNGDPCANIAGAASDSGGSHGYISTGTFTPSATSTLAAVFNDYATNQGALGSSFIANMDNIFTYTGNKPDLTTISSTRDIGGNCSGHNCYLMEMFCGTGGPLKSEVLVTTAAWHYALGQCNSASSMVSIDGVEKTGNAGTDAYSPWVMHINYMALEVSRYMEETGFWDNLLMNSTQRTNLYSNMRSFWGF